MTPDEVTKRAETISAISLELEKSGRFDDGVKSLVWAARIYDHVLAQSLTESGKGAEPLLLPNQWPHGTRVKVPGREEVGRVGEYSSDGMVHVNFPIGSWFGKTADLTLWETHRDLLGRTVRLAWVRWAKTQPAPKPSWLVPYDDLSEPDKEADRQIGEALYYSYAAPPSPPVDTTLPSRYTRQDGDALKPLGQGTRS